MFIDEVKVTFRAGKGGDGCVSWRREKYIPNGGPYGGNGGRGGAVILKATVNETTLIDFRHKKVIKAEAGSRGESKEMAGRSGEDLIVLVPVGTIVSDAENSGIIVDLMYDGAEFLLCEWGKGGFGNAHFKSSVRQAPNFAELGDEGEGRYVQLELKLVADVGLVGLPNAGKSTLISAITNVRPKIAPYPFTTLIPNLGVMEYKGRGITIEDVPGLIEGASNGKGLGIQFLRHIERTAIICHLLDLAEDDDTIVQNYQTVRSELEKFSVNLSEKEEIVIFSKLDLVPPDEQEARVKKLSKKFKGSTLFALSAGTLLHVEAFKDFLVTKIPEQQRHIEDFDTPPVIAPAYYDLREIKNPRMVKVTQTGPLTFEVTGERIEEIARMTNMQNRDALARMYDVMEKERVISRVQSLLVLSGNEVKDSFFEGSEDEEFEDVKITISERVFPLSKVRFLKG